MKPAWSIYFSWKWEDPYGQKFIDAKINGDCNNQSIFEVYLEKRAMLKLTPLLYLVILDMILLYKYNII